MQKKNNTIIFFKQISLFFLIGFVVWVVNLPSIFFSMYYPEQPSIYVANQQITTLSDLIHIYLYPQLFDLVIPFFRPSGHFLMYQLLAPLLGWHNIKGFICVNLFFLALVGFFIIKVYALLFPRYKIGGYIAFSYYLMHPALSLSRLIVLHFEFIYIFFSMAGLYYFISFCQKNLVNIQVSTGKTLQLHYFSGLFLALLFFMIAVTFKEPAIMMGPVYFVYFYINFYGMGVFKKKQFLQVLLLIIFFTLILSIYLILPWPTYANPVHHNCEFEKIVATLNEFLKYIFATSYNVFPKATLELPAMVWRPIVFPWAAKGVIWTAFVVVLLSALKIVYSKKNVSIQYRKSLLFLSTGCLLFLILPIGWAIGLPWHLSTLLLFLSLIIGFAVEYFLHLVTNKKIINVMGGILALMIAAVAIPVNQDNIQRYTADKGTLLDLLLNKNAVLSPPAIKKQLNNDSVIIVADHLDRGDYILGNTADPQHFYHEYNRNFVIMQESVFLKAHNYYNGTLFKFAYLMPDLKEEIYPFALDQIQKVPDHIIYEWLAQGSNIFCLDYDEQGHWYDRTVLFKKLLQVEQKRRHLVVNPYRDLPGMAIGGVALTKIKLTRPDFKTCQYLCDQKLYMCAGFTYLNFITPQYRIIECSFYTQISEDKQQFCPSCVGFIKNRN